MKVTLVHICLPFFEEENKLTDSIPSELGELTSMTLLTLGMWIGLFV
jgi:hypothetical protein